jgi:hypothetical protein
MKSITPTLSGLASSLFLNVGLTRVAEKLDPARTYQVKTSEAFSSGPTTVPCLFTPRPGNSND